MSSALLENSTPVSITWTHDELEDIINTAVERGMDPIKMMREAILEDLHR